MRVGYARVSTMDQKEDLQLDALAAQGCEKIFKDVMSGALHDRPGLTAALQFLRKGDTLVVWKLDRLGRTLRSLIQFINDLKDRQIHVVSVHENIDTTTPTGKLVFHLFGALAEFERDVIIQRTKAGLEAARSRGRVGGRKKKLTPSQVHQLRALYHAKSTPLNDLCHTFGIAKPTLYKYLKES